MLHTEVKLAFDLRKYETLSLRQRIRPFSSDLAALAIETKPRDKGPLITPFVYEIDIKDQVVACPEFSPNDIRQHFSSPDIQKTCDLLLDPDKYEGGQMIILWISGPLGVAEPESRITLTVSHITSDQKAQAKNYSGLCTTLTNLDCLNLANYAKLFSPETVSNFRSVDEVRIYPIQISVPVGLDPYEFVLTSVLPLPEVLQKITSGEADSLKEDYLESAQAVANIIAPAMIGLSTLDDYINLGARAEHLMMSATNSIMTGTGSGCGLLNSEMVGTRTTIVSSSESGSSCTAIVCPNCGWSPDQSEVAAIENGTMTCCPNKKCRYDPATRTANPSREQNIPVGTYVNFSPKPTYTEPVITPESGLAWSIYFFFPWLDVEFVG